MAWRRTKGGHDYEEGANIKRERRASIGVLHARIDGKVNNTHGVYGGVWFLGEREHWSWLVHGHLIPEGVSIALGMVVVVIAVYTHTGSS
jgi:hypothetical protein